MNELVIDFEKELRRVISEDEECDFSLEDIPPSELKEILDEAKEYFLDEPEVRLYLDVNITAALYNHGYFVDNDEDIIDEYKKWEDRHNLRRKK